jgi:hypothetical protein
LDPAEAAEAEDADDALTTLNALLAEWHEAEIGLPDYSFASLQTEVASDAADREAIAYQLAERLAPEYDVELPPLAMKASAEAMNRLRLRYFQPGTVSSAELPGECNTYNINTDA